MKIAHTWALAAALCAASPMLRAGAASFQVRTDISKAPRTAAFAEKSQAICEEWYPTINEILFGSAHALPFREIEIVFEATKPAAFVRDNVIHISANQENRVDDFGGMVIHELTHIVQNYKFDPKGGSWVSEGIADYVRHKYFEKDIEPKLQMDGKGYLTGYTIAAPYLFGLQQTRARLERKGYRRAYTVASAFLFWLEVRKDKDIVRKLNVALSQGRYSPKLFQLHCGEALDRLWKEFVATLLNY